MTSLEQAPFVDESEPTVSLARLGDRRVTSPDALPWTDAGNAERLCALHGGEILFCHTWSRWLVWDGRRWRVDDTGDVVRRAKETVRAMLNAALDADQREYAKFALKSESDPRIRGMLTLARSSRPVLPEALDSDPWLLNVENGTIDLRSGRLLAHDRERLLTKLAPVEYDPDAEARLWLAFLERIMRGRAHLVAYLQRAFGYSLTGSTREQILFLLYGIGANGKSTFVETCRKTLGDYAMQSPAETLLDRREGVPNDVARLRGARFVSSIETGEGRRLAEAMVKQMTGGDTIPARFMRSEWFEFRPTFKLWLATNHLPTVRGTDEAIWRRIHLVPFEVTIPEQERDGDLPEKLRAELPGILAWAVAGCAAWQAAGRLERPDEIRDATAGYRADMDVLGEWIADRCITREGIRGLAKTLYADYRGWSEERGERPLTQTSFGRRLRDRGYHDLRGSKGIRLRDGISLRAGDEYSEQVTGSDDLTAGTEPERVTGDELVAGSPRTGPNARASEDKGNNPPQPATRHRQHFDPEQPSSLPWDEPSFSALDARAEDGATS